MVSPTELTMTMDKPYNHTWFLYNDLSQITPMPAAWDRTASGPSNCAAKVGDCQAVYSYLNAQARDLSTYATSPLWSIVDGPWKLSAFSPDGHLTLVPNESYSGPVKPRLAQFQEVPFPTDSAEYAVLRSPGSGTRSTWATCRGQRPGPAGGAAAGSNPVQGLLPGPVAGLGHQLLRGELPVHGSRPRRDHQAAVLPPGAGVPDEPGRGDPRAAAGLRGAHDRPGGHQPGDLVAVAPGQEGNPYPFSPAKAKELLTSHGWKVVPNGVSTCTGPAKCGPGISQGAALSFNLPYATGVSWITSEMTQLQSSAAAVGIRLNLQPEPFDQVTARQRATAWWPS